jgi:hypothetical protein
MKTTGLLAFLASLAALVLTVLSQQLPPTVGIQLSDSDQIDIRFPLTVSQCDAVLIYYNTTRSSSVGIDTAIPAEDTRLRRLITLSIPTGIGYLVWMCNIPAGYSFIAEYSYRRFFTVQPGSSSSCLRDVTATYSAADYLTSDFGTYTANPPHTTSPSIPAAQLAGYVLSLPVNH